jgi:hypothetical protein
VVRSYERGIAPVYNLEVEGEHEYFAEGILVHNCVWALTELAAGTDGWAGYVKQAATELSKAGLVAPIPEARILVDGSNRDVCECGSVVWSTMDGKQVCFKCQKPRPQ